MLFRLPGNTSVPLTILFLVTFFSVSLPPVLAQDMAAAPDAEEAIDTLETAEWVGALVFDISATQVGYQNWVEGGVNSFAFNTRLDGEAGRASDSWLQSYRMRLALGVVKQDSLEVRKAEDLIRLAAALQYAGEGFFRTFRPTLSGELRTQFTAGFNYNQNPFEDDERDPPVKVSDFFSPATLTQSIGLTYEPTGWLRQRLGVAARETIVVLTRFRPLYGVPPDQLLRFQLGVESNTDLRIDITDNIRYRGSLNLFAAFDQDDLPDMLWENELVMDINRFLNVRLELTGFYDRDLSRRLQLKQILSLGVSVAII